MRRTERRLRRFSEWRRASRAAGPARPVAPLAGEAVRWMLRRVVRRRARFIDDCDDHVDQALRRRLRSLCRRRRPHPDQAVRCRRRSLRRSRTPCPALGPCRSNGRRGGAGSSARSATGSGSAATASPARPAGGAARIPVITGRSGYPPATRRTASPSRSGSVAGTRASAFSPWPAIRRPRPARRQPRAGRAGAGVCAVRLTGSARQASSMRAGRWGGPCLVRPQPCRVLDRTH